jgi:hemerythrin-like metal-binding protein
MWSSFESIVRQSWASTAPYWIAEFVASGKEPFEMSIVPVKILQWTPEYSVHDAVIDREHQFLFDVINRLHEAMLAGQGRDALRTLLADVMQYTDYHFIHEEKLMAEARYPQLPAHIQMHKELTRQVSAIAERFEQGENTISIEFVIFLSNWLTHHVMVDDRRFGEYGKAEH